MKVNVDNKLDMISKAFLRNALFKNICFIDWVFIKSASHSVILSLSFNFVSDSKNIDIKKNNFGTKDIASNIGVVSISS